MQMLIDEKKIIDHTKLLIKNYYQKPVRLESDKSSIQYVWGAMKLLELEDPCSMWIVMEIIRNDFEKECDYPFQIKFFPQGLSEDIKTYLSENRINTENLCYAYGVYNRKNVFARIREAFITNPLTQELGVRGLNPAAEANVIQWLKESGATEEEVKGMSFSKNTVQKFFHAEPANARENSLDKPRIDVGSATLKDSLKKAKVCVVKFRQSLINPYSDAMKRSNSLSFILNARDISIELKCVVLHAFMHDRINQGKTGTTFREILVKSLSADAISEIFDISKDFAKTNKIEDLKAFQINLLDMLVNKSEFFEKKNLNTSMVVDECQKVKTSHRANIAF